MITPTFDWQVNTDEPSDEFVKLVKKQKLDELAAKILWKRELRTEDELTTFLNPSLENLHDPFLFYSMSRAVERIRQAVENQETILIYGDYDADGMTSASIMKTALDEIGAESLVYLPNRFTDGYGPNLDVYKYFIENESVSLIITVDNGVSGHEAVAYAQENACDVIITDHHSLPETLPDAYAIIHPEHPDGRYPFGELAGCGVAFKVACALLEYIPSEMLDLVAIGTVADMMTLTDENRILVKFGIEILKNTERIGLEALINVIDIDKSDITEETIAFQIAPRLNALGRIDDPNPAIELLTGWDENETQAIAEMIDRKNIERKEIVAEMLVAAESQLDDSPVQFIYQTGWNPGVLGIVAGQLLQKTGKPIVMLSEENGLLKGSARSIPTFNIFEALTAHKELFITFGGHAQAAGMTFELANLPEIKAGIADFITKNKLDLSQKNQLILDESITLSDLTLETIKSLSKLAPFGQGNPKPQFLVSDYQVVQSRAMGQGNAHLKLKIQQDKAQIEAVYFGHGAESLDFEQSAPDLAVTLSVNTWNGNTAIQLMVVDARVTGVQLIDLRNQQNQTKIPKNALIFTNNTENSVIMSDVIVVAEVPDSAENLIRLTEILAQHEFVAVYFQNQMTYHYYLTGGGTREQFAKFYKTIYQYPEFDVRYKLKNLADFLKIPDILLVKMVQIFEELEFVTIADGLMTVNKAATKRQFTESQIYQELQETVKMQAFFALSPVRDIYNELKNK
ncbi:single-stranded-DNA-specific exonuclease RecJ [Lactococcus hodotermopsidis]|uniref:Single-stranded-DNA-specific exonuclease RecJ n=1 Tax=Pseudolactococcus hodotermopsidis TaxID=2709157 RepID=A0A6A0BCM1_9LACT|nr:single-stranded-DNA-specific exonuclease RecJ [Lactococcus hodotermopsidis]GFH42395.1 single-stranded-DNA-specific exonuclease RecJ [Lactococcus hodotermopsidis]